MPGISSGHGFEIENGHFPSRAYIMKDKKCQSRSKYLSRRANEQNVQVCLRGIRTSEVD